MIMKRAVQDPPRNRSSERSAKNPIGFFSTTEELCSERGTENANAFSRVFESRTAYESEGLTGRAGFEPVTPTLLSTC